MGIGMASMSEKFSKDILSLTKLNDWEIATSFYGNRQKRDRGIRFCLNS